METLQKMQMFDLNRPKEVTVFIEVCEEDIKESLPDNKEKSTPDMRANEKHKTEIKEKSCPLSKKPRKDNERKPSRSKIQENDQVTAKENSAQAEKTQSLETHKSVEAFNQVDNMSTFTLEAQSEHQRFREQHNPQERLLNNNSNSMVTPITITEPDTVLRSHLAPQNHYQNENSSRFDTLRSLHFISNKIIEILTYKVPPEPRNLMSEIGFRKHIADFKARIFFSCYKYVLKHIVPWVTEVKVINSFIMRTVSNAKHRSQLIHPQDVQQILDEMVKWCQQKQICDINRINNENLSTMPYNQGFNHLRPQNNQNHDVHRNVTNIVTKNGFHPNSLLQTMPQQRPPPPPYSHSQPYTSPINSNCNSLQPAVLVVSNCSRLPVNPINTNTVNAKQTQKIEVSKQKEATKCLFSIGSPVGKIQINVDANIYNTVLNTAQPKSLDTFDTAHHQSIHERTTPKLSNLENNPTRKSSEFTKIKDPSNNIEYNTFSIENSNELYTGQKSLDGGVCIMSQLQQQPDVNRALNNVDVLIDRCTEYASNTEGARSSISRDSGFMSPVNFNEGMSPVMQRNPIEEEVTPVITHITSLNQNAPYIRKGVCNVCKQETHKQCIGCYRIYYCTRKCQEVDWHIHKLFCSSTN